MLRRSKEKLEKLYNTNQKKCNELAQEFTNVAMQLKIQDEACKEVQSTLRIEK
jgi:hypothetical protein